MPKLPIQEPDLERKVTIPAPPSCPLLEEMRANPRGDWTIKDVETLCAQVGLKLKKPTRGTHYKVSGKGMPMIVTVPYNRPIKTPYIRQLVFFADQFRSQLGAK